MSFKTKKIAVCIGNKDCLRIVPIGNDLQRPELKFSFFDDSFTIRTFKKNNKEDLLLYSPIDKGLVSHELTYHNSSNRFLKSAILPKHINDQRRTAIFKEIINLDLNDLILPIPICRITVNNIPKKMYKEKKHNHTIQIDSKYNTTELYIASKNYDHKKIAKFFPMISTGIFPITTTDAIIYGAGFGSEPIFNKMLETGKTIIAMEQADIGDFKIFYRNYELVKNDKFRIYHNIDYGKNNYIEFFNNIEYLDIIATTSISFKSQKDGKISSPKPAYKLDAEYQKKSKVPIEFIKKWEKRFSIKETEYRNFKKFRSGMIFNV